MNSAFPPEENAAFGYKIHMSLFSSEKILFRQYLAIAMKERK